MTPTPEVQERLRRYLLGQLDDGTRQELEQSLLASDETFQELLLLEDEIADGYLNGELNDIDREAFEKHFLITAERREKLRFSRALGHYVSTHAADAMPEGLPLLPVSTTARLAWLPHSLFSSPLAIVAFAALVIGVALGIWRIFFYQSEVDKGLIALNAAYKEQRPLESRISALAYAPYPNVRGPNDAVRFDSLARTRAEAILSTAVNEHPNASSHHALGQVFLASRRVDEAIQQFDAALKLGSIDPELYNDRAAAWIEKGKIESSGDESGKGSADFARALADLNKALELENGLLDARFNRALCLQFMLLPDQAESEWREYLKRDSTSPWAEEAQRSLKQLEERRKQDSQINPAEDFRRAYQIADDQSAWKIVSLHRDLSGGPVANTIVDSYLDLTLKENSEGSSRALAELAYVAKLEKNFAGDLFIDEVTRNLSSLSKPQLASMIEARRLLKLGQKSLLDGDNDVAIDDLKKAKEIFVRMNQTGEAIYVDYPIAHGLLGQKKSNVALSAFEDVIQKAEEHHYKWLEAQSLNAKANTLIGLTSHSAALEASERSLRLSREINDTTGIIKTTEQLAAEYFRLGNYPKSLVLHHQSLASATTTTTEAMQLWRNYFLIAMPLEAMGLHAAAIEYENEALRRAEALHQSIEISRSYSLLGLMYAGEGAIPEAIRNGTEAIESARAIHDDRARQEALAYSTLQLALIYRQAGEFDKAIANYDQAIEGYRNLDNFPAFNYVAHKGKLLSCINQHACGFAEQEINTCLELFRQYRNNIHEQSNRLPFFDTEQGIYDIATEYAFSKQNYELAFEYSEQSRSGTLRELSQNKIRLIRGATGEPDVELREGSPALTFRQLQAEISPDTQVIQYSVLQDKLIIWLISRTQFLHQEREIQRTDLDEIVRRYLSRVSSPSSKDEDVARQGGAVYEILIRPVENALDRNKLLCIVPDKILHYLPFSALVPAPGSYLIDEFRIMTAPSLTTLVNSTATAAKKAEMQSESLLAVGNPHLNRAEFPQLGDLPAAENEARSISRLYGNSATILVGDEVRKQQVLARLGKASVVHLAAHSIVDEESPLRSRLILTAESNSPDNGALQAYELLGIEMPATRLVVLSACDTGTGRYYGGEGVMGLSQTFLAAGVPLVVATLWSVDSEATADLMIDFHRLRKQGSLSTAAALQQAQRDMAIGKDLRYRQPYYWAGFTLMGGYATF